VKVGKFYVSRCFFRSLGDDEGTNLFHRMVVLRAHEDFCRNSTVYIAIHPDFRQIDQGEITPEYEAIFNSTSAYPKWRELPPW
jgi:hypothetical protein